MLKPGDKAPDFELPDADMEIIRLSDFRNRRNVVLYFYVRDNTPGCTTEAIEFSDLEADLDKLGWAVMGVSRDDCISHGVFRDKHGISIRLLADKDCEACKAYGVMVKKEVDGVMRDGVQRSTFLIDDKGVVRHAMYGVTAKGHANEVLRLIKGI
jgi:peroxiredoxin Q/BCP